MTDAKSPDTRERLVEAGQQLFRTQGYAATGLKQLTQAAEVPWGSLYHFFPAGKEQLGAEVIRYAGRLYDAGWKGAFARFSVPAIAIEKVFLNEVKVLAGSDYRDGCPIASVTLDSGSGSEALRAACAEAFGLWLDSIREGLAAAGAPNDEAIALAGFVLSALEGAIVLARAAKDPAPLRQSARYVRAVVAREAEGWKPLNRSSRRPRSRGA